MEGVGEQNMLNKHTITCIFSHEFADSENGYFF